MKKLGKTLDIAFDFGGNVGNSTDSLRLILYVQKEYGLEKAEALADLLAHLHFEKKRCVCDHATLRFAAAELGVEESKVSRVLKDPVIFRAALFDEIERLHQRGIHSIPFFEITGVGEVKEDEGRVKLRHAVVRGAASEVEFYNILRRNIFRSA